MMKFRTSGHLLNMYYYVLTLYLIVISGEPQPPSTTHQNLVYNAGTPSSSPQRDILREFLQDSKGTLANMLHYQGLEDPPNAGPADDVPEYIKLTYNALNSLKTGGWQQNRRLPPRKEIDQTIWGIKAHQVLRHHNQLKFVLQTEVFRVNISRAELVFHRPISISHRMRHGSRSTGSTRHLTICSAEHRQRHCSTNPTPTSDSIHINGKFYHIYNITTAFLTWLTNIQSQNSTFPIFISIPERETIPTRRHMSSVAGQEEPMLVLFSNVHQLALQEHIMPQFNTIANRRHGRQPGRFRRSVPQVASPGSNPTSVPPPVSEAPTSPGSNPPPYCSLVRWYVDFSFIGWDSFIYEPTGYYGNLCLGSCDIPVLGNHVNITNHAFVKNLYKLEMQYQPHHNDIGVVPEVTCVPIRINPISILFRSGNHTYVNRRLHDMSVTGCGCL